jgi:glutaredoxin
MSGNLQIKRLLEEIQENSHKKIIFYTLEGCPYCEKAVNLLNKNKQIVKVKEFAKLKPKQKEVVSKRQGRDFQTFPRIFNKEFVGGFTDLEKLFPSKGYIF